MSAQLERVFPSSLWSSGCVRYETANASRRNFSPYSTSPSHSAISIGMEFFIVTSSQRTSCSLTTHRPTAGLPQDSGQARLSRLNVGPWRTLGWRFGHQTLRQSVLARSVSSHQSAFVRPSSPLPRTFTHMHAWYSMCSVRSDLMPTPRSLKSSLRPRFPPTRPIEKFTQVTSSTRSLQQFIRRTREVTLRPTRTKPHQRTHTKGLHHAHCLAQPYPLLRCSP